MAECLRANGVVCEVWALGGLYAPVWRLGRYVTVAGGGGVGACG